jgi:hypothetical protein
MKSRVLIKRDEKNRQGLNKRKKIEGRQTSVLI